MKQKKSILQSQFVRKYILILVFILMMGVFGFFNPNFLSAQNISNTLLSLTASGFLGIAGMFILISNEFDLSLGYNLCFDMIIGAILISKGCPLALALLVMIAVGTGVGLLNGFLVVKFDISAFIVTLATGLAMSGLSQAISNGSIITITSPALLAFTRNTIGKNGIGFCVILLLATFLVLEYLLQHTIFGRKLFAVGVSKKVAHMAAINVDFVRIMAFTIAGFFVSIGGIILMGQLGAASPGYGTSYLLPGYATVFLSTTAIRPGYINVPGAILAMLIVNFGSNGVELIGGSTAVSNIFQGVLFIFAMWLSTRFSRTTLMGQGTE